jgi:hypothetical protein
MRQRASMLIQEQSMKDRSCLRGEGDRYLYFPPFALPNPQSASLFLFLNIQQQLLPRDPLASSMSLAC